MIKYIIIFILSFLCGICKGQNCKIGDVITNRDGSRGVVFWVSEDGKKGWMVALHDASKVVSWGVQGVSVPDLEDQGDVGLRSLYNSMLDTAGYSNTQTILDFQGETDLYAAQSVDFKQGWYLPALGQLRKLYSARKVIEPIIVANGGSQFKIVDGFYYSSTEGSSDYAWICLFKTGQIAVVTKSSQCPVRPVRSFDVDTMQYDTTLTYQWSTGATEPYIVEKPLHTITYSVKASSGAGCAATASKEVFVASADPVVIHDSICHGEIYRKHGFEESRTGEYSHTLSNAAGCEQLIVLKLKVNEPVLTIIEDTIAEGEIYAKNNFNVWKQGEYKQVWKSKNGCDSTVILKLFICRNVHTVFYDTICEGEVHNQNGFVATTTGDYDLHLQSMSGCDSLVTLHLTVLPVYDILIQDTTCAGSTYKKYGFEFQQVAEGQLVDVLHLQSMSGCDSLVTLHLTVLPVYDILIQDTTCVGSTYKKYGFEFQQVAEGQLVDVLHLQSMSGCDSSVMIQLTVHPSYFSQQTAFVCAGESFDFHGELLQNSGIYYDTLRTQWGCDSVLELQLEVRPVYADTIRAVICSGERYQQHGFDESVAGFYKRSELTEQGCDSIICLNLEVSEYFNGNMISRLEDCALHEYSFKVDWVDQEPIIGSRYIWYFGDGEIGVGENLVHTYADSGNYQIVLEAITLANCSRTVSSSLAVPYYSEELLIYAEPQAIDSEHPEIYVWTDSIAQMHYVWDLGDGTKSTGCSVRHVYAFDERRTYLITLERVNGEDCRVEQTLLIDAFLIIAPPNTFSPNGDGLNDYFMKGYQVRIFDRNGVEIFRGEDGWDGTRNGQQVPEDTYFYELYYVIRSEMKTKKGYITVIH